MVHRHKTKNVLSGTGRAATRDLNKTQSLGVGGVGAASFKTEQILATARHEEEKEKTGEFSKQLARSK